MIRSAVHDFSNNPCSAEQDNQTAHTTALSLLIGLFLVGATLLVYWPVLHAQAKGFDDDNYLTHNYLLQSPSLKSVARFFSEVRHPSVVPGYYHPLALASLMADYAISGQIEDLTAYHRTQLILHTLNVLLVFLLMLQLFRQPCAAGAVALLFALHPLHVEAVAWIAERKTLLSAFFALLSMVCYVRYANRCRRVWLVLSLLAFALALLSKPTVIMLPVLLVLLDYWPLGRLNRSTLLEKIPFLLLALASGVVTWMSHASTVGMGTAGGLTITQIPLLIAHNVVFYLDKIGWPRNLSPHYPFPEPISFSNWGMIASLAGTMGLMGILLISLRWTRSLFVGGAFLLLALLPMLGLVGYTNVPAADKYLYLPMIGLLLPLAWFIKLFWQNSTGGERGVLGIIVLVLAVVCGMGTRRQLAVWKTTDTLCARMAQVAPNSGQVRQHWSAYLLSIGKPDEARKVLGEAADVETAGTHGNRGAYLIGTGDIEGAIREYQQGLALDERNPALHYNIGSAYLIRKDLQHAQRHFDRALQLRPDYPSALLGKGVILVERGELNEAIRLFRRSVELKPTAHAHYNLGMALLQAGSQDAAMREFQTALQLDPQHQQARNAMATIRTDAATSRPAPSATQP